MDHIHHSTNLPLAAIGALALGQKIQAIKIVRTETALGLPEAKALVEAYEKEHPDIRPQPISDMNSPTSTWLWLGVLLIVIAGLGWLIVLPH